MKILELVHVTNRAIKRRLRSRLLNTVADASYHPSSAFDCRKELEFEDPFLRRTAIQTPAGECSVAVVSLVGSEKIEQAAQRAPEAVAKVAAAIRHAPPELVQKVADHIRQPLRRLTTQFLHVLVVHAYMRRLVLEQRDPPNVPNRQKVTRIRLLVRRAFESTGEEIYADSAEAILGHLAVMAESGASREALGKRLTELVIERAIALTEFPAEFLDLPRRSAQGLAYLLGDSDNSEVYEIENVAISVRDDDEGKAVLRDFIRTRTKLPTWGETADYWRQALARMIWQGYGQTCTSWTTSSEPLHYLLHSAYNCYRREYLGPEIPLDAEELPPDDLLAENHPHLIDWGETHRVLASTPIEAVVFGPRWGDIIAEIDIEQGLNAAGLGEHVQRVVERYRAAERSNRLPELPKPVERARPRLEELFAAYRKPRHSGRQKR